MIVYEVIHSDGWRLFDITNDVNDEMFFSKYDDAVEFVESEIQNRIEEILENTEFKDILDSGMKIETEEMKKDGYSLYKIIECSVRCKMDICGNDIKDTLRFYYTYGIKPIGVF